MFFDFKAAFKDRQFYKTNIPQSVLDVISKDLPKGFRYADMNNGLCRIETEDEFHIDVGNIKLPKTAKSILSADPLMSDIWSYAYNTQQKIEIQPYEDGCYIINGKAIKAEDFVKAPFDNIEFKETNFYLVPPSFPEPFPITIGSEEGCVLTIRIQRQPYESLTAMKFDSVANSAIEMSYIIDLKAEKATFSFSIARVEGKTIQDIVNANHIYNAFMYGKGTIMGETIPACDPKANIVSDEVVQFWDNVLELQKYLDKEFIPGDEITVNLVNKIKELYECFIRKKPFKRFENFNNITGSGYNEVANMREVIGKEVYFEISISDTFILFGVELKCYKLIGIFGATVKSIEAFDENDRDDYRIELEPTDGKNMYSATMYFLNEDELQEYKSNKEHISILHDADLLIYIS